MTSPGREDFIAVLKEAFEFLERRGFRSTAEGDAMVLYESVDGVFVRAFCDAREMHVGFRVGLASRPKDALTDAELGLLDGGGGSLETRLQDEGVRALAIAAAHELETLGDRALAGDQTIFDEAMLLRREHTRGYVGDDPVDPPRSRS